MKVDSLWDYSPGPLDSLRNPIKILPTTIFTNHTTTWKEFEIFSGISPLKNIGGANFILLMLTKISFLSVNYITTT